MVSAIFASMRPAHATCAQARGEEIECRSWQPDSYGTGGILADDYRTIQWFKINALSGGTSYMPTGLGLRPWYLKGFAPVQPIASVAPAPIAAAPEGALPPAAEAPAGRGPFLMKPSILSIVYLPCLLPQWSIQGAIIDINQAAHCQCGARAKRGRARGRAAACHRGARSLGPFIENILSLLLVPRLLSHHVGLSDKHQMRYIRLEISGTPPAPTATAYRCTLLPAAA